MKTTSAQKLEIIRKVTLQKKKIIFSTPFDKMYMDLHFFGLPPLYFCANLGVRSAGVNLVRVLPPKLRHID